MRPTWHFVAPTDIRWMLKLTAPRVNAASGYNYRKLELDDAVFHKSNKALARALRGGKQLTRDELRKAVGHVGVATNDLLRFSHILLRAELDGVICSGPRKGKQFTYAMLDERAPKSRILARDEALAELTLRYFTSHGPARLQDFVWWSGLATSDARNGLETIQSQLVKEVIDGKTYWRSSSLSVRKPASRVAYLLPSFDEYLVAYKDRSAALYSPSSMNAIERNPIFNSVIVVGGRVVGGWKRAFQADSVIITLSPFVSFTKSETIAVTEAAHRYATFLGKSMVLDLKITQP